MENVKKFLKTIGVEDSTINLITSSEPVEDLNVEELSSNYISNQKNLSKNDPDLIKGIRDEIRGTELSKIEHSIKKQFNLTPEDIRDKKFNEILETAFNKLKVEFGSSSEELQNKVLELNNQVKRYEEEILPEERSKAKSEIQKFRRDLAVRDILAKKDLIVGTEVIFPALNSILSGYDVTIDEANKLDIKTKDGLKPLSKDGTKTLSFEDIIENKLNELNVIKKSNGSASAEELNGKVHKKEPSLNSESVSTGSQTNYHLPGMKKAIQAAESLKEMKTFGS
tara:strand:+ start:20942 stop:21787 length:846 start_codon:yes stop_codon:yes gene_type:complete